MGPLSTSMLVWRSVLLRRCVLALLQGSGLMPVTGQADALWPAMQVSARLVARQKGFSIQKTGLLLGNLI